MRLFSFLKTRLSRDDFSRIVLKELGFVNSYSWTSPVEIATLSEAAPVRGFRTGVLSLSFRSKTCRGLEDCYHGLCPDGPPPY